MSDTSTNINSRGNALAGANPARLVDYLMLLKPRVMSLVVFTAFVGLILAPGEIDGLRAAMALIAIAAGAGAAGALNMWYDADIDAHMERTAARPIPAGHIARDLALGVGLALAGLSVPVLGLAANWTAAGLLALTIGYYIIVYTIWLKRKTPQNIVIGGAAGAFPPMIGWAVVTGGVSLESLALFLIIFLWTPPHFWALALYRTDDYQRAGVPMMPVVAGPDATRTQIAIYACVLIPATFLPVAMAMAGWIYTGVAVPAGLIFLFLVWRVHRQRFGVVAQRCAAQLFGYSIFYLFVLFAAMAAERIASNAGWTTAGVA